MFDIARLFKRNPSGVSAPDMMTKDRIAELLKVSPEALTAFEESYNKNVLSQESDDVLEMNSRQASARARAIDTNADPEKDAFEAAAEARKMVYQIVEELVSQTQIYSFDGNLDAEFQKLKALPTPGPEITTQDIVALPEPLRPQLTGNLMKKDIMGQGSEMIMFFYMMWQDPKSTPAKKKMAYDQFRQGLDLLDLDALTYEIIGTNKNSMGYWLPKLVEACQGQDFFRIPATKIAKVPLTMLQLTRCGYDELTQPTLDIVDRWAMEVFGLDTTKDYFIKTGTYSSKFDFRNAKVTGAKEVRELGEYLLFIHFQALQMASPLCQPTIYGVSTTNEWVVREFIPDKESNPTIYKGLPLHTEYRVFVDCDKDEVIACNPYWDPETMKKRFAHGNDANSPHQIHDYITYKAHESVLMDRYNENLERVMNAVRDILPNLDLPGQWSLDIMQNGDDFWLIDMALAEQSAFYEVVPPSKRKSLPEEWLPKLPEAQK